MPLGAGSLGRLVDLRDGVIERVSAQLDEIARALVAGFAERDSLGVLPDVAGLFSAGTSTAVPPDGIRFAGLSTALRLNPAYDPAAGGDAFRVRDAGSGGAAYVANPSGSAGFAEHVIELGRRLSAARSYDVSAGVDARGGPAAYAEAAAADLAQGLQQASADHEARAAVAARAGDALARAVGISLDEEMATMLQLERSFQASSRLLTAIDDLYRVLIASVGAA
jgi:flagellar hook-associated protein 1 FlgK